jgi:outer membrane lipoprotein SlyB
MHRLRFLLSIVLLGSVSLLNALAQAQNAPEIPSGTTVRIRIIDKLSSEDNQVGDAFHATLEDPITVDGKDLYPKGADVTGRIADLHKSGRLSEPGELDLVLNQVTSGSMTSTLRVQPLVIKGESHTKSNVEKVGGGAALGAIIGAIAGGGKGAAIGTVAGGAAGTGAAAATGKKAATVASETVLSFTTVADSGVVAQNVPAQDHATENQSSAASPAAQSPTPGGDASRLFSLRDKRVIRDCVAEHTSDFPPGTTERPELPPGTDRQLERGQTLSPDVQKAAQSLPLACVQQLPALPGDLERVVYSGRVLLIDSNSKVLDVFPLQGSQ